MTRRIFALLLCCCMIAALLPTAGVHASMGSISGDLNGYEPTKAEIRDKFYQVTEPVNMYEQAPSVTAPYVAGYPSETFLDSGLTYLNYVRYVANLPEVQLDEELTQDAQYGAVLLAAVDTLTHTPSQPEDMDDDFYARGYAATTSSNILQTWDIHNDSVNREILRRSIRAYMQDYGSSNIATVGHRRWLLNPTLLNVGFGFASAPDSLFGYSTTKVFDESGEGCDYDFISWPASGNFPTELFRNDTPWSVTLNLEKYQFPNRDDLIIQITRESDGRIWYFDGSTSQVVDSASPFMLVNCQFYGVPNCIIFNPGSDSIGDYDGAYWVAISGLKTIDGEDAVIYYDVEFFDVESGDCESCNFEVVVTEATCYGAGYTNYFCPDCHHRKETIDSDPLGHTYADGFCIRCGEPESGLVASGIAGDHITWLLDGNYHLSFTGYGEMYDFSDPHSENPAPWSIYMSVIKTVSMDDEITSVGDYAFNYCKAITSISLPDSLTRIGDHAFEYCDGLTSLSIPDGVLSIGEDAFGYCTGLASVPLPSGLEQLGQSAFSGCSALTSIVIPEGVTSLEGYTFYGCTALEQVTLPQSLTSISYGCFEYCASLGSIELPSALETLGYEVFAESGLNTVTFTGSAPTFSGYGFFNNVTATVYYPAGDATWTEDVRQQYGGTLTWVGTEIETHNWSAATCTEPMICQDCGKIYGEALGHAFGDWYETQAPSCNFPGIMQRDCARCGHSETMETSITAHSYEAVVTAPTCTEDGYTTHICTACGSRYVDSHVPATGHSMGDWYETQAPTCTVAGIEQQDCSVCGHSETREKPATGHSCESVVTSPTCTEGGYTTHTCSACGDSYVDSLTDPLGHQWKGLSCSRCGAHRDNPFTDVAEGAFYYDAVLWAVENGVTNGITETTFAPNSVCNRGQVVTFLWRAAGSPEPASSEHPFVDVSETAFYYKAMLWAVEMGITNGVDATHFGPNQPCSRGQVVTFLWRAKGSEETGSTASPFTDVAEGSFCYKAVLWAVENDITNGITPTTFQPGQSCNRGQVVTFLYRAYN